ncbi:hypothetical protein M5D96_000449 [Drosophila gunungcola]|uniref:Uncharacterized protein n=1 Tax=Drosophila gunungcola TaxID=103775 RepID=A0A9P9YWB2_9MUSC|nr:hypothetical protein M5D96_000449 [Drosophila gunungcola]
MKCHLQKCAYFKRDTRRRSLCPHSFHESIHIHIHNHPFSLATISC